MQEQGVFFAPFAEFPLRPLRLKILTANTAKNRRQGHREQQDHQSPQPASLGDSVLAALQARLQIIEAELVRMTDLACKAQDRDRQEQYWQLAQDLQREARKIRAEINSRARTQGSHL